MPRAEVNVSSGEICQPGTQRNLSVAAKTWIAWVSRNQSLASRVHFTLASKIVTNGMDAPTLNGIEMCQSAGGVFTVHQNGLEATSPIGSSATTFIPPKYRLIPTRHWTVLETGPKMQTRYQDRHLCRGPANSVLLSNAAFSLVTAFVIGIVRKTIPASEYGE